MIVKSIEDSSYPKRNSSQSPKIAKFIHVSLVDSNEGSSRINEEVIHEQNKQEIQIFNVNHQEKTSKSEQVTRKLILLSFLKFFFI
jgi:hypothetical protein